MWRGRGRAIWVGRFRIGVVLLSWYIYIYIQVYIYIHMCIYIYIDAHPFRVVSKESQSFEFIFCCDAHLLSAKRGARRSSTSSDYGVFGRVVLQFCTILLNKLHFSFNSGVLQWVSSPSWLEFLQIAMEDNMLQELAGQPVALLIQLFPQLGSLF